MSFEPLAALAPGILRKIFGAIDSAAQPDQNGGSSTAQTDPAVPGRDRAAGPGANSFAAPD